MTLKTKPPRTEVCIIGAGASGAAAAKVLTERGVRVVALERGPWRGKETFGGDELANVNRYNLWPDPLLNPRTARTSPNEKAHLEMFCPVPQMVGGGTVHWQGWLPRFTPNDFRIRTIAGEVKGATLADWPIGYDELEPYYAKVEWAFGVSGRAGANKFEGPRSVGLSLSAAASVALCREIQQGLQCAGLERFSDAPGGVVARLQRSQAHGDQRVRATAWRPTGTRSSALNVFVPDAAKTGRYDLRADSYVRELTLGADGSVKSAVYQDADGDLVEQEADLFILACGAVESARLLLLSKSARFPNGLANGSDLVGRNVTFHEYSAAVGLFDDPIYAWAGGGYVSASSFQFYEHDEKRGHISGGHIACAGVGIPLPINWRLPDAPAWGAAAKRNDRDNFNHSMAVAMVLHDMPRHDNRVDLDDEVRDAWGLPAARDHSDAARERHEAGALPDRSRGGHPGSRGIEARPEGLRPARDRQLFASAWNAADGNGPDEVRPRQILPRARGRQSLCSRWIAISHRDGRQPDADDHGQRLARRCDDRRTARRAGLNGMPEPSEVLGKGAPELWRRSLRLQITSDAPLRFNSLDQWQALNRRRLVAVDVSLVGRLHRILRYRAFAGAASAQREHISGRHTLKLQLGTGEDEEQGQNIIGVEPGTDCRVAIQYCSLCAALLQVAGEILSGACSARRRLAQELVFRRNLFGGQIGEREDGFSRIVGWQGRKLPSSACIQPWAFMEFPASATLPISRGLRPCGASRRRAPSRDRRELASPPTTPSFPFRGRSFA